MKRKTKYIAFGALGLVLAAYAGVSGIDPPVVRTLICHPLFVTHAAGTALESRIERFAKTDLPIARQTPALPPGFLT